MCASTALRRRPSTTTTSPRPTSSASRRPPRPRPPPTAWPTQLPRRAAFPVIIGGPHPTFVADEALAHADFVARGEGGERLMLELIEALPAARAREHPRALVLARRSRRAQRVARAPRRPRFRPAARPLADRGRRAHPGDARHDQPGLPVRLHLLHGHDYVRPRATATAAPRTSSPSSRPSGPASVFFYDDNFAADKRRLKTLLQLMIDAASPCLGTAQVRTDVARDEELLALMRRSGCRRLALGLRVDQPGDPGRLRQVADRRGHRARHRCPSRHGIKSHGMFVLGADSDTTKSVRDTVDFAMKHRIDTLMLNVLTPGHWYAAVRRQWTPAAASSTGAGILRRPARRVHARA